MLYMWIYVTLAIQYIQVATSQPYSGANGKPGRCPAVRPNSNGPCVDLPICNVDSDCQGVQKCCPNGCGHECFFPVDPKPGTCPILSPGTGGPCAETCRLDSDCQGVQKCCSNGCGHSCFPPVTVKPGTCPTLAPDTFGTCVDLCSEDSDCLSDQKCCSHGCGHSCSSPASTPTCGPFCNKLPCPFGFVLDENNCPICECKTGCTGNAKPLPSFNCAQGPGCPSSYHCVTVPRGTFGVCCPVECPQGFCTTQCPYGYKFDDNGCQTCECLPACPKAICPSRQCKHGFKYDATGCQTCNCRSVSCPARLCPWSCPEGYKLGKDGCQTCDCSTGTPCPPEPMCPLPDSPHPFCPGSCVYQIRILDGTKCRVNCFRGPSPPPGRPGDPCPPTGCPGKPTRTAVQRDFPSNPPGTPPGNCPVGNPLPGFNCGLIQNPDRCPPGSFCNTDPMDRFGVCCLNHRCPFDPGPNSNCYGHYQRYCKKDPSCPKGKKCCKQGCYYKCVDAV